MGPNPDGKFVLQVEDIQLRPELQSSATFRLAAADAAAAAAAAGGTGSGNSRGGSSSGGKAITSLRLIQSHGDQVRPCKGRPPATSRLSHLCGSQPNRPGVGGSWRAW